MATNITARLCETKVAKRTKVYDAKCPGLYVFISTKGVATFYFKYWDRALEKNIDVKIGEYSAEHLTVEAARARCYDLRGRKGSGEDIAQTTRIAMEQLAITSGKKVGEIINEYTDWMKEPVRKADRELRPRIESWETIAGYLERFARPALGHMVASEVENDHIAKLQNDIARGKVSKKFKASVSSARNTRTALSGMFKWAAEAGRKYVKASPCVNLPKLDKEVSRDRVLSASEIKTLWWGLDHPNLPCSRDIALALKFELVTLLRTKEFLRATRSEAINLGQADAQLHVPLKRVKKRRVIVRPLNTLGQEIIAEATATEDGGEYIFKGKFAGEPLDDKALGHAVRGFTDKKGKVVRQGICKFLGMDHWTPHDLRRTGATLAGDLGFTDAEIARCLDHSVDDGADAAPTVTGVYVRSKRIGERRKLLDAVAAALREIIGSPPKVVRLKAA
jgi:integrase